MSRQSINYALHNPAAWPNSRADDADEVIRLRGELAAVLAQLDAANERARLMAADLSRVAVINAGQANIIWTQAHELDALRNRQPLTLTTAVQMATDAGEKLTVTFPPAGTITFDVAECVPVGATIHSATLTLTDRGDAADGYGVTL